MEGLNWALYHQEEDRMTEVIFFLLIIIYMKVSFWSNSYVRLNRDIQFCAESRTVAVRPGCRLEVIKGNWWRIIKPLCPLWSTTVYPSIIHPSLISSRTVFAVFCSSVDWCHFNRKWKWPPSDSRCQLFIRKASKYSKSCGFAHHVQRNRPLALTD